ncbi:MAG: PocR ligand-binding domain-containing protein [Desulfobacterales bacterium]|nr:PocR ligand-binding domain-containing protein [Desulfobacterales bacterium]
MSDKPTYEDLERKLRELEAAESGRKRAEEALRKHQAMFNKVLDSVPQSIFWKDHEGRYLGCNRVFAAAVGLAEPEQIIGKTDYDLPWPREDADAYRADDREVLQSNQPKRHIIEPLQQADGLRLWIDTSKAPLLDEGGRPFGVLGVYEDITERKLMEDALEKRMLALTKPLSDPEGIAFVDLFNVKDLQRLQDEFAQATGVASIITHPDGTPITAPSNFCRLCSEIIRQTEAGRSNCFHSDAIIGRTCANGPTIQTCLSGGLWDAGAGISVGGRHLANWLIGQVRDETQTEEKMRVYARAIGADEDRVVEAFRTVPAMSREQFGRVAQVLFTLANQLSTLAYHNVQQARLISDLKKAEKEQKHLQLQLIQAQKMESVGRLAGGVAHDFNNMLSIISGNAEMILQDADRDFPFFENLQEISKAAERSTNLTRQLLAFARKQTIAPKVLDLNETLEGMLKMLRRLIGEDIDLAWLPKQELWPVKVDPSQIDQMLTNLCINARDSIKGVGKVTIETANVSFDEEYCREHDECLPGDFIGIVVSDNGCGMDQQTLEILFEPFFTTKEIGKGTGLGLATVYGIVKQNNGFINVYSELGSGTTFKAYLPRYAEVIEKAPQKGSEMAVGTGDETILVVEDEKGILQMTTKILERLGYKVLSASSPLEAIRTAESYAGKIDMLISDVVMPEMSGRDMAAKLLQAYPGLKCLFMSGYTANVIAHHGILDEGIRFINKPFSMKALAAKVREILNEPQK